MITIATQRLPAYSIQVKLEGETYTLSFQQNDRGDFWVMDVGDDEGVPIVAGIKLVLYYGLIGNFALEGLPPGDFAVIDLTGTLDAVGIDDLGRLAELVYLTREELDAI